MKFISNTKTGFQTVINWLCSFYWLLPLLLALKAGGNWPEGGVIFFFLPSSSADMAVEFFIGNNIYHRFGNSYGSGFRFLIKSPDFSNKHE